MEINRGRQWRLKNVGNGGRSYWKPKSTEGCSVSFWEKEEEDACD